MELFKYRFYRLFRLIVSQMHIKLLSKMENNCVLGKKLACKYSAVISFHHTGGVSERRRYRMPHRRLGNESNSKSYQKNNMLSISDVSAKKGQF